MYLLKCNFRVAIIYGYLDRTVVSQGPSSVNIMGKANASVVTLRQLYDNSKIIITVFPDYKLISMSSSGASLKCKQPSLTSNTAWKITV